MQFQKLFRLLSSEWAVLVMLLCIAAFFRFYQLDMIPAEFEYDEWVESFDALDMQQHGLRIFSTLNKGRELLFAYLVMAGFSLVGPEAIVLRIIGATAGTLTVVATYFLVREMFRTELPRQARWIASLTSLAMAVSFWQILHTRMGRRHVLLPLLLTLAFYFLWRGLNTGHRRAFVISGVLVGACLYTYPAARFIPVMLVAFFGVEWLIRFTHRSPVVSLWQAHRRNLLFLAAATALVFAPLGYYFFVEAPDQFFRRASQVSVLSVEESDTANTLWHSITGNLAGLAFHGDEDPLYNIPGRPMLTPILAIAFGIGLMVALRHYRQAPYLFALLWWLVMMFPAFLVADNVPAFKRAIGIAPAVYIFPALALVTFGQWLKQWGATRNRPALTGGLAVLVPILVFAFVGGLTFRDYFWRWGAEHPQYQDVLAYRDIARKMLADGRQDEVWIFPLDTRNIIRRYYRLNGFTSYSGLPPRQFIAADEQRMFDQLSAATQGVSRVVLVNVKSGQEWQADSKEVFPFLFEKYGRPTETYISPDYAYDLTSYQLDSAETRFQPAGAWQPLNISFGPNLALVGADFGDASGVSSPEAKQTPAGERAWVTLHWQAVDLLPADYQASLRLIDPDGRVIGQVDKLMTNVRHGGTSRWKPGEEVIDYYLLPVEPGTLPANYTVSVLVYLPQTFEALPVDLPTAQANQAPIGQFAVMPALTPAPLTAENSLQKEWLPDLQFVGTRALPAQLQPGDTLDLALRWQSQAQLTIEARFGVELTGQAKTWPLASEVPVGSRSYPTTAWQPGEGIEQWLRVRLPVDAPSGRYQLQLVGSQSSETVTLGELELESRPHQFELPPTVQHRVETTLGEQIRLVGFDLDFPQPDTLTLTLYWQALTSIDNNYKAFVHVLDGQERLVTQRDQIPMNGQAPTTSWLPGEIIADPYTFSVPPGSLPPDTYRLGVGLYDETTKQRLAVPQNPDNYFVLPKPIPIG